MNRKLSPQFIVDHTETLTELEDQFAHPDSIKESLYDLIMNLNELADTTTNENVKLFYQLLKKDTLNVVNLLDRLTGRATIMHKIDLLERGSKRDFPRDVMKIFNPMTLLKKQRSSIEIPGIDVLDILGEIIGHIVRRCQKIISKLQLNPPKNVDFEDTDSLAKYLQRKGYLKVDIIKKSERIGVYDFKRDVDFIQKIQNNLTEYRDLFKQIYPPVRTKIDVSWICKASQNGQQCGASITFGSRCPKCGKLYSFDHDHYKKKITELSKSKFLFKDINFGEYFTISEMIVEISPSLVHSNLWWTVQAMLTESIHEIGLLCDAAQATKLGKQAQDRELQRYYFAYTAILEGISVIKRIGKDLDMNRIMAKLKGDTAWTMRYFDYLYQLLIKKLAPGTKTSWREKTIKDVLLKLRLIGFINETIKGFNILDVSHPVIVAYEEFVQTHITKLPSKEEIKADIESGREQERLRPNA